MSLEACFREDGEEDALALPMTPDAHSRSGPESPGESAGKAVGALKYLIDLKEKGEARVPPYGPGTAQPQEGWSIARGARAWIGQG